MIIVFCVVCVRTCEEERFDVEDEFKEEGAVGAERRIYNNGDWRAEVFIEG
jgi:hypothetical protein